MPDQNADHVSLSEFCGYILQSNTSLLTIKEIEHDQFILLIQPLPSGIGPTLSNSADLSQPQIFRSLDACARFALRNFKVRTYSVELLDSPGLS